MTTSEGEESDQLPEEGPEGQVFEDDSEESRKAAKDSPGAASDQDSDKATGNPKAAGQDD